MKAYEKLLEPITIGTCLLYTSFGLFVQIARNVEDFR